MRKTVIPALTLLFIALVMAVMPTENEGAIYEDTVRLHILASSDDREDQQLKLSVRDAVLKEYGATLSLFDSAAEAKEELSKKLTEIEEFADKTVCELGYGYKTKVSLTEEWYDTRDYESFSLPAGYYTSLRIIIGEGEGQNWWCVMFPPLCLDVLSTDKGYSDAEELLITRKYNVKFKILELISRATK